jgi:superfamily I DNA/RNA helicase/CRISPR/Cas system-associated exonuclease Cas4 (RecB family)
MSHWDLIRERARLRRASVLVDPGGDERASSLLAAADRLTGFTRVALPHGDPLLDGALSSLDRDAKRIWYDADIDAGMALFYQAHEYAHLWLHGQPTVCDETDVDPDADDDDIPLGAQRVEAYGPNERLEREANVFAREFLLPLILTRDWYAAGERVPAIEARTGVPQSIVLHQVARAVLVPLAPASSDMPVTPEPPLDGSQQAAAHAPRGPLLVQAGPGTGKTRTLCGRVVHLLSKGVAPGSILALTFSNKAAEAMRERVARARPDAAPEIWMGTFHAYGLELLRKYGSRVGLGPKPDVLDPSDAVLLLESRLADLDLVNYQYLPEPARDLRHVVNAISRAKDELAAPADYARYAEEMRVASTSENDREAASKAAEVARVYRVYQETLDAQGLLDFGDLIAKAVRLLAENQDVREEVRRARLHVLVDEYQDVNRASARFLRELVGAGAGLWVVGDARQSIYRFRGASPDNMRLFAVDFPGAKVLPLRRNYRSGAAIVRVVSGFGSMMPAAAGGGGFSSWEVHRETTGQVAMEVADAFASEAAGLTRMIKARHAGGEGVPFRSQAILCRSHTWLARIGAALEAADIPIFYLGDLFERREVRDLLSLLSLSAESDGSGLLRVARFPEYQVPLVDVLHLFELARAKGLYFPEALSLTQDAPGISERGKAALALLARHLADVHFGMRAWTVLSSYLFVHSEFLKPLLADNSVPGQQRRLAIYQLLRFASEYRSRWATGPRMSPCRQFLQHVRWLEALGEEKQLRQMPSWAEGVDAVRLMTVHSSKGLEFDSLYVPVLARGVFPAKQQWRPCPPPPQMVDTSPEQHEAEEACLFFVALSRATDVLCLSRADRYSSRGSGPSSLLEQIAHFLPRSPAGAVSWPAPGVPPPPTEPGPEASTGREFTASELDVYMKCRREYFYRHVLQVRASSDRSAYGRFHHCVYAVLLWLGDQWREGHRPDAAAALQRLADVWADEGPRGCPHEPMYRRVADSLIERAGARRRTGVRVPSPTWRVQLAHGVVILEPDDLEDEPDGSIVAERVRTGRPTKDDLKGDLDDIYALYVAAARQAASGSRVQVRFLSADAVLPVSLKEKALTTRLGHYDAAIVGIARAEFGPDPKEHRCPRCAYYFICPAAEDK